MRGITILFNNNSIHTGEDLGLVQEEKTIGSPTIQSYLVQVPGRNGLLNLTKGLTGRVCYDNRPLSFKYLGTGTREELLELKDMFYNYHGETITIIDDDTPDYYYEGEATIAHNFGYNYLTLNLEVNANPFRYRLDITSTSASLSDSSKDLVINNYGVPVVPTITVSSSAKITKGDVEYTLSEGVYTLDELELDKGVNVFNVSGSGELVVSYREARL